MLACRTRANCGPANMASTLTPLQELHMKRSTTSWMAAAALAAACLGLSGCANNAQLGTGAGAVAGGLLGDAVLGGSLGTLGGAAAGAVIGNQIGQTQDMKR